MQLHSLFAQLEEEIRKLIKEEVARQVASSSSRVEEKPLLFEQSFDQKVKEDTIKIKNETPRRFQSRGIQAAKTVLKAILDRSINNNRKKSFGQSFDYTPPKPVNTSGFQDSPVSSSAPEMVKKDGFIDFGPGMIMPNQASTATDADMTEKTDVNKNMYQAYDVLKAIKARRNAVSSSP